MEIRKARKTDISAISRIYDLIHTAEEAGTVTIGWIRDVYPTEATARDAFSRGDLFVMMEDNTVVGAAIINQLQGEMYRGAPWEFPASDDQIMVLHTLVISLAVQSRGYGRSFVRFYEDHARASGCNYLRMDTNARNTQARKLYAGLGYREIDIVPCTFNGIEGVDLVLLEKSLS